MDSSATSAPDFCATPERATKRLLEMFELLPERHAASIEELLMAGANPAVRGQQGCTPLHYAASNNDLDLVALLLRYHAPINATNDLNSTPLHYAARIRSYDTLRYLLANGADPSIANDFGDTALMAAANWPASHYDNEADSHLLKHPLCDINARNHQGLTALEIAMTQNAARMAARLASAGAHIPERFEHTTWLRNRVRMAHDKWNSFINHPTPEATTLADLLHFANIGKLGEALNPVLWSGHETKLNQLFNELHPCLQKLAIEQSPALMHVVSQLLPDTQIHDWTQHQSVAPNRSRA